MLRNIVTRNLKNVRQFGRVTKYQGQNINITEHNPEKREDLPDNNGLWNSWNMGYEGFS